MKEMFKPNTILFNDQITLVVITNNRVCKKTVYVKLVVYVWICNIIKPLVNINTWLPAISADINHSLDDNSNISDSYGKHAYM